MTKVALECGHAIRTRPTWSVWADREWTERGPL